MSLTYEEARKELLEYKDNIKYLEEKQNDALEMTSRIENAVQRLTGVPAGKGYKEKYALEEYIDRMKKITAECDKKLQELLIKKFIVEEKIDKLEQPYKSILYLRFIRGIEIEDIKIGYSRRQKFRIQKEGILKYAEL